MKESSLLEAPFPYGHNICFPWNQYVSFLSSSSEPYQVIHILMKDNPHQYCTLLLQIFPFLTCLSSLLPFFLSIKNISNKAKVRLPHYQATRHCFYLHISLSVHVWFYIHALRFSQQSNKVGNFLTRFSQMGKQVQRGWIICLRSYSLSLKTELCL